MRDTPDFDGPAFEARLEHEMRNAVSAIDPDIERTLDLIRSDSGRDGLRG